MTSQSSPDIVALADEIEDSYSGNFVQDILLDEKDRKLIVAALRARSSAGSVDAERERCIAICEGWIGSFQDTEIQYTSPREYAVDAIEDIIDLIRDGRPAPAQPSADIGEPVAWQFRQRSGVGKGPQSQAPWGDWCGIEREDYERYTREPNPLIQVRPLYTGVAQPPAEVNCRDCGRAIDTAHILSHPRSCIVCDPEFGDPRLALSSTNHHTPQEK